MRICADEQPVHTDTWKYFSMPVHFPSFKNKYNFSEWSII
jgi:hypothetical protein